MKISEKLLQVEDLRKSYGSDQNKTEALRGITFNVIPGEFLGIMGASGSGKTTLLNCIATILHPTAGKILLNGEDIFAYKGNDLADYRGKEIGYLFQEFELLDNLTGRENIVLPLAIHNEMPERSEAKLKRLANQLEIASVLDKFPSQMSGGEKQRVAAARALISDPSIVLADEPTGALDSKSAKNLMSKLSFINREDGAAILMVTHDANAASYCSRILFIEDGMIFHELRREAPAESQTAFYDRIMTVMAQLGGGSVNVL
jgi:putative ABC transport system ATP-binding protein